MPTLFHLNPGRQGHVQELQHKNALIKHVNGTVSRPSSILKIHNSARNGGGEGSRRGREKESEGCEGSAHECRCVGITCHVILVHIYRGGKHAATQGQAEGRAAEERVCVKVAGPARPCGGRARIRCKL